MFKVETPFEDCMTCSAAEFAEKNKVDYAVASGFLKFLESKGVAKVISKRPNVNGKGKPTSIWAIPIQMAFGFQEAA